MQKNRIRVTLSAFTLTIMLLNIQYIGCSLDTSKYISIDEVRTDMEAYCLTVFYGTEIEKFDLEILSIVQNSKPGQNMILVKGTDERFAKTSAVHGCSGSPVYIDGRMAGALAAGWDGSLESLYLVRPIQDMLEVGIAGSDSGVTNAVSMMNDDVQMLDLKASYWAGQPSTATSIPTCPPTTSLTTASEMKCSSPWAQPSPDRPT